MQKIKLILLISIVFNFSLLSQGGMWLPNELEGFVYKDMKAMGLKMKSDKIYNETKPSIKDAIVKFGGGCTGGVISEEGLVITNHHCGYGSIQRLSTVENNLLQNGYWADSYTNELPASGLSVTIVEKIVDVTDKILDGVTEKMTNSEMQSTVDKNINKVKSGYNTDGFHTVEIKPFYYGNKYYLFQNVIFKDIRLAGVAPESVGKFGNDTDNWMWPRHNADFAVFRIYADQNNEPAGYSEDNVPYKSKYFLPVSANGLEEGDFTMVFGFPGTTEEYLPALGVDMTANKIDPELIKIRETALNIMDKYMRQDEATKLKLSSKYAGIANYWKKWIGENQGINASGAVQKKMDYEDDFSRRLKAKPGLEEKYGKLLLEFCTHYGDYKDYSVAQNKIYETYVRNIDFMTIMSLTARLKNVITNNGQEAYENYKARLIPYLKGLYDQMDPQIDKEIFGALTKLYKETSEERFVFSSLTNLKSDADFQSFTDKIYSSSFSNYENIKAVLDTNDYKYVFNQLENDPAYNFAMEINTLNDKYVSPNFNKYNQKIDSLQKRFMQAQIEAFPEKKFFPDANGTLRLTYGEVKGYSPRDAVYYEPFTHIEGVMEKYRPGDYEFDLPQQFIDIYNSHDFAGYTDKTGSVPVCAIGTNHTTGGNSGSPVLDARGNFVGINFDRVWEGTMSDLYYDPDICRNIMVDSRYILFIIDKFSGSKRLTSEMKLVETK